MDEKPDEKAGKCVVSLWLDPAIRDALDSRAKDIERSRSWMASLILKQALGLMPDSDKKKLL
jgi:predicted transcriptional regulator